MDSNPRPNSVGVHNSKFTEVIIKLFIIKQQCYIWLLWKAERYGILNFVTPYVGIDVINKPVYKDNEFVI